MNHTVYPINDRDGFDSNESTEAILFFFFVFNWILVFRLSLFHITFRDIVLRRIYISSATFIRTTLEEIPWITLANLLLKTNPRGESNKYLSSSCSVTPHMISGRRSRDLVLMQMRERGWSQQWRTCATKRSVAGLGGDIRRVSKRVWNIGGWRDSLGG